MQSRPCFQKPTDSLGTWLAQMIPAQGRIARSRRVFFLNMLGKRFPQRLTCEGLHPESEWQRVEMPAEEEEAH